MIYLYYFAFAAMILPLLIDVEALYAYYDMR